MTKLSDINNRYEFRAWLTENHATEKECWVVIKRGKPVDDNHFWYIDAVEEALCFGWVDSVRKIRESIQEVACQFHKENFRRQNVWRME